jgi:hypothetical protein
MLSRMMIIVSSVFVSSLVVNSNVRPNFHLSSAYRPYQLVVDHFHTEGSFLESVIRFWSAELASGLVCLRSKGIMRQYAFFCGHTT